MKMNTPRVNRDTTEAAAQSIAVTERIQIHPTSNIKTFTRMEASSTFCYFMIIIIIISSIHDKQKE